MVTLLSILLLACAVLLLVFVVVDIVEECRWQMEAEE